MAGSKPWLNFYEPHVPESIEYPDIVLPEFLEQTARAFPDREALIFKGSRITFSELHQLVARFASALQKLGVRKGVRVAIHLPNCPQYVISYYAVLWLGGIVVPCNPLYQAHEMTHQLKDSGAEVIITLSAFYPLVRRIRSETQLKHVVVAEIKSYFPTVLKLLFTLFVEKKKGHRVRFEGDAHTYAFVKLLQQESDGLRPVLVSPEDTAVLMYTGGTTGISKGAQLTHRNILVNALQCKAWLHSSPGVETTLTQVPLFHCYGMTTCMNFGVVNANTMVLVPDPRDLEDIVKSIHNCRPTIYPGVPAMYNAINNYPHIDRYDLSSIKACVSGAAGLPLEIQQNFQRITGAHLVEGYGLSEAAPITHGNPVFGDNRIGSIGLPWPDTEAILVDIETGEFECPPGEPGELCIRGPQVMKGYWNMPVETANALRDRGDGAGLWLYTGDIAQMDEDGFFRIVDRKKDMILGAGGYNIYPREIEDMLYTHPKVLEAAAVGIPVDGKGERIKAFVVLKPEQTATEEEMIEFCRANLAAYKVPKFFEFRDQLPKTMVGKILRRELLPQPESQVPEKVLA